LDAADALAVADTLAVTGGLAGGGALTGGALRDAEAAGVGASCPCPNTSHPSPAPMHSVATLRPTASHVAGRRSTGLAFPHALPCTVLAPGRLGACTEISTDAPLGSPGMLRCDAPPTGIGVTAAGAGATPARES